MYDSYEEVPETFNSLPLQQDCITLLLLFPILFSCPLIFSFSYSRVSFIILVYFLLISETCPSFSSSLPPQYKITRTRKEKITERETWITRIGRNGRRQNQTITRVFIWRTNATEHSRVNQDICPFPNGRQARRNDKSADRSQISGARIQSEKHDF